MRVFLSWSGDSSRQAALVLRDWIPKVIQSVAPWMSFEDIGKGKRWGGELARELDESRFGIICLTPDNLHSAWIHFEAGAVAKSIAGSLEQGRVTPLLLGVQPSAMPGPLAHFQATTFDSADFYRLMTDLNGATESPLSERLLSESFDMWWPSLNTSIQDLLTRLTVDPNGVESKPPPQAELLEEILTSVRSQERQLLRLEAALERPRPVLPPTITTTTSTTTRPPSTSTTRSPKTTTIVVPSSGSSTSERDDGESDPHRIVIARDDPCYCGSGQKYKMCHGR